MRRAAAVVLVVGLAALAGCGDDDDPATTPSAPAATATAPAMTTPAATAPTTPATTSPTATTGVPDQSPETGPGAGDEEPIRVPAAFTIAAAGVDPEQVTVPAFLTVEVQLTASDGRAHDVDVQAPGGGLVALAAGGTARLTLAGLQPGTYPVLVDGGRLRAVLRATRESPGP